MSAVLSLLSARHVFIEGGAGRIHAVDFGGEGVPLVCLHGVTGHAWMWHDVVHSLAGRRRVVAIDLRGHGDSQWSATGAYTSEDHLGDLEDVIGALGLEQVDVVGASWGALIGIGYAARQPHRVRRLALIDVEPSFTQSEHDVVARPQWFVSIESVIEWERRANPAASERALLMHALLSTTERVGGGRVRKHDPFFFSRWPFRNDDRWDELRALKLPVLVMHGERSFVRREVAETMARECFNGRFIDVPGVGHLIPLEAPQTLANTLYSFLVEQE